NLPEYDARVITSDKAMADYYLDLTRCCNNYKAASNWVMGTIKSYLNDNGLSFTDFQVEAKKISDIINLVDAGELNNSQAKEVIFKSILENPSKDVLTLATELNVLISNNEDELEQFIDSALSKFSSKVQDYHNGKKGV